MIDFATLLWARVRLRSSRLRLRGWRGLLSALCVRIL